MTDAITSAVGESTSIALVAAKVEGGLVDDPDRGFGIHGLESVGEAGRCRRLSAARLPADHHESHPRPTTNPKSRKSDQRGLKTLRPNWTCPTNRESDSKKSKEKGRTAAGSYSDGGGTTEAMRLWIRASARNLCWICCFTALML
ncbi:hypothetical protein GW17_00026506 [Ensete ventricosum]|uniref:Uncharacterized protein n=1 Tax=Ensete ventricosum TaxID=4639 RepID=A0A444EI23_ENSVE|nr:hypothetical protein B296_00045388 [Ensete ventricosum]RWW09972.1 hypothetical protein GW17_00026506 [Ensete ventricosum]